MRLFDQDVVPQLDSGSNSFVSLPTDSFDRIQLSTQAPFVSNFMSVMGGNQTQRTMRLPVLDMAGHQFCKVIVDETRGHPPHLGLAFLSRFLVTIDFPNRRVYLQPGKQIDRVDENDMSGMHINRPQRESLIHFLEHDNPAYEAGIRDGDILLAVNQKPAQDYDIEDLRALLRSGDGQPISVTYRRGDETKTISFKLRRRI